MRYPILLVHGTGVRDFRHVGYWGRIPAALEGRGARVYTGGQDAWATVEENAAVLRQRALQILHETGAEKLHVIAHSKGGLDARHMMAHPDMAGRVASLTTVSTPHHGSKTMDALCRMPAWVFRLGGVLVNGWYRLLGDQHPDFCRVCCQFTTAWAEVFNRDHPDLEGVYYRSYAGVMDTSFGDVFLSIPHFIIRWVEGENDGLVTVKSAQWTNFQPPWRGAGRRGVSHMDEADFRRRALRRGGVEVDPTNWYIEILSTLEEIEGE